MLQWLFPLAITIHNMEEAIWLPEWSRYAGRFHRQVEKIEFRFAVCVLTILAWTITYLSVTGGKQSIGVYLLCAYSLAMLINVFIPHLAATLLLRRYAPGLVTGLVLNLPVCLLILSAAFRQDYITLNSFLISSITFIAALIGIIPLLFRTGSVLKSLVMKKE